MEPLNMDWCDGCDDAYDEKPVAIVTFRHRHTGETFVDAFCSVCVAAVLANGDDYDDVVVRSF